MSPTTLLPAPATLLAAAEARAKAASKSEPAWLAERRREAFARVASRGLPTPRDEEWKYTNVARLAALPLGRAPAVAPASIADAVKRMRLPLSGGIHVVVIDGRFAPELSAIPPLPDGIFVGSLAEGIRRDPDALEGALAAIATGGDRPFADLSTASFEDGFLLRLGKDVCCPVPIDVLHLTSGSGSASFPRTLVIAGDESRATIVERFWPLHDGPYAVMPVTEVSLGRNAAVEHLAWQEDATDAFHVATLEARQDCDSRFTSHALTLGAALARIDTGVKLLGEGAECTLNGLYLVTGGRHADHHTRIDHVKPHGTSRELFKGILEGGGTGVFNGKIVVHPGAKRTDSVQANHNLLLTTDCSVDSKPELEIHHDDVKCAHGMTIGQLDEDQIFYLRTRGLAAGEARDLLVRAFARDVTDRVSIEAVHARLERWMTERLPVLGAGKVAK